MVDSWRWEGQVIPSADPLLARALVPAGSFGMGSRGRRDDEEPPHRVFVSAFEIALTPVTNEHYARYRRSTTTEPPLWWEDERFDDPNQPVVGVNWMEARAFCRWLAGESGLAIRLPTEAEREKASRGGRERTAFPWGDDPEDGGHENIVGPLDGPDRVALLAPNDYGLYNMADLVHEWCLDGYDQSFYARSPRQDPCAPPRKRRAARGGSWRHHRVVTPCAARSSLPPEFHYSDFGFRWVIGPRPRG